MGAVFVRGRSAGAGIRARHKSGLPCARLFQKISCGFPQFYRDFDRIMTALTSPYRLVACAAALIVLLSLPQPTFADANQTMKGETPCFLVPPPPVRVATRSKYFGDDIAKSSIDPAAERRRRDAVRGLQTSLKALEKRAYSGKGPEAACALKVLSGWAAAKSLTDMGTQDALLSRDRWIAEIALALIAASRQVPPSNDQSAAFQAWLDPIGQDIVTTYERRVGPKSRINNHRAWAGLATAAIGIAVHDRDLIDWARKSYDVTACQIDADGHLPEEMARGSRALHYHLYALRPFATTAMLFRANGIALNSHCPSAANRLARATCAGLKDPGIYERLTGKAQIYSTSESAFSPPLRLSAIGLGACLVKS